MFFSAGLYGAGLIVAASRLGAPAGASLAGARRRRAAGGSSIGLLALRTTGVAFMIVTHDVRAGLLPHDPLFRRLDARRRGLRARRSGARAPIGGRSTSPTDRRATARRSRCSPSCCSSTPGARPLAAHGRVLVADPRERGAHPHARLRHLPLTSSLALAVSGTICAAPRRRLCAAVRLCRRDLRLGAIFDPAAALGAARRRRHRARAARRHAAHVLPRRHHQRLHRRPIC